MTLLVLLKVLHVAAASVWIGAGLTIGGDIEESLALGPPHTGALLPRLRRVAQVMNRSALLTFVSGLGLMVVIGFAALPYRIHAGWLLALAAVAAGRWLIRPVIVEIAQAVKAPVTPSEAARLVGRFRRAVSVEHALRLAVLVLMIVPY